MDGPQHYTEAQDLLEQAAKEGTGTDIEAYYLKASHVHAMLAVAAASVDGAYRNNAVRWNEAMGVH